MAVKKMQRRIVLAGSVAALALLGARTAPAALIIDYQNGTTQVTDNGAGDSDPTPGRIINTANVAGFGVAITVAASNSPGTASGGLLQIQSLDVQNLNPAAATLIIRVRDTGFTLPAGTAMNLSNSVGGTFTNSPNGDLLTFQSFADPSNADPAAAVNTAALVFNKSTTANPESFSGSNSIGWVRGAGAYSLMDKTTMSLSPGAQMNVSGTTLATAVPEPVTGLGLLAAVGGLTLRSRRRR